MFGKRDELLRSSTAHGILHPIPIRTKFHNYKPTISAIIRSSGGRLADDPVLSRYFPTAPFPVWINHRNLKGILSYKQTSFDDNVQNKEYSTFKYQKFNRPMPRKRLYTL